MDNALTYLSALEANNNREWYHGNKQLYQQANAEFERLIEKLIASVGEYDPGVIHNAPKDLTFKLVRDTRFSNDKTPYNPTFRAHISPAGKRPVPVGCFISIMPGNRSFLGGGLFAPMFKDATTMIRDYLADHGREFDAVIQNEPFSAMFKVKGEALKNVPKGYDAAHPQAEYLKFKSWYLEYPISDDYILSGDFASKAAEVFRTMKPFNDYLNAALINFKMPSR